MAASVPIAIGTPNSRARCTLHREYLDQDCKGLFPFVPLMQGGAHRKIVEEIIERLQPAHDTISKELLALTALFAGLAFSRPEDKAWVKRRFEMLNNIFQDNFMYDFFVEKGLEKGREEGLEKGREEGYQEVRKTLLAMVQAHFPTLSHLATTQADQIKDVTILAKVIAGISTAQTLENAQYVLLSWNHADTADK